MKKYYISFISGGSHGWVSVEIPEAALDRLMDALKASFGPAVDITVREDSNA